jgi:hypothetical protein
LQGELDIDFWHMPLAPTGIAPTNRGSVTIPPVAVKEEIAFAAQATDAAAPMSWRSSFI